MARRKRGSQLPMARASRNTGMDLVERWKSRLAHARRIRKDWEERYKVRILEDFYAGKQVFGQEEDRPAHAWMNHFFATIQSQRPVLMPKEIRFVVTSKPGRSPVKRLTAKIGAGVLEAIAERDGHLEDSVRLALTQAFFRVGVLKCTYEPRFEKNPQGGEPLLSEEERVLAGEGSEKLLEPGEILDDEIYRWDWVNACNMLFPEDGPSMDRWSWVAEEVEVSLEDAREDPRFRRYKNQLRANSRAGDLERGSRASEREYSVDDDESAPFCYTECWDLRKSRLYIIAEGQDFDGFLVDAAYPDGIEDHPYSILSFTPQVDFQSCPWPIPYTYNWLPLQEEYNTMRQLQLSAGKHAARKVIYDAATFPDEEEARKYLESAQDMEGVMVNDITRPPVVLGEGAQSPDVARNIPFLMADWQRITGSSGTRLGDPDAATATEATLVEQAANVRDSEMQQIVYRWLARAGAKMLQLVRQTLTLELWVQMRDMGEREFQEFLTSPGLSAYLATRVGEQNVPQFLQMATLPGFAEQLREKFGHLKPLRVSQSELQWESDVEVLPSTIRPLYQAKLMQLAKVLGPMALMSPTLVEEFLLSFDIPQGEAIAQELATAIQQQQQAQMMKQSGGAGNSVASPLGPSGGNPLAAVNGGMIGV